MIEQRPSPLCTVADWTAAALVLCAGVFAAPAYAQPELLSNQGYLESVTGEPLTGTHDLTFALYGEADATNPPVWSETQAVEFVDGTYSVILGRTEPVDADLLSLSALYLGLSVDEGALMMPLHEVVSVPYAISANTARNVYGGEVDASSVAVDGETVIDGDGAVHATGLSVNGTPVIAADGTFIGPLPPTPDLGCADGERLTWNGTMDAWACGADAFAGTVAEGLTADDVARWDEAYGWGDHADAPYLQFDGDDPPTAPISASAIDAWNSAAGAAETDPIFNESAASLIDRTDLEGWHRVADAWLDSGAEWDAAYSLVETGAPAWDAAASLVERNSAAWDAASGFIDGSDLPASGSLSATSMAQWTQTAVTVSTNAASWTNTATQWFANGADLIAAANVMDATDPPAPDSIGATEIDRWNAAGELHTEIDGVATLYMDGDALIRGDLTAEGATELTTLDVTNLLTAQDRLEVEGDAHLRRDLQLDGTLSCPATTSRVGAFCVSDVVQPSMNHASASVACWERGMQLCPAEALVACTILTGITHDCGGFVPSTWTASGVQNATDYWHLNEGQALRYGTDINGFYGSVVTRDRADAAPSWCCIPAR